MVTVVLFDIDGTLVRAGGAGKRAITDAFFHVMGVADAFESQSFSGRTDPDILAVASHQHLNRDLHADETAAILDHYLSRLDETLQTYPFTVLPGVVDLLTHLTNRPDVLVGLATGNVHSGAYRKLARGGLDPYFSFGGFGSDARCRATLTAVGFERGWSTWMEQHQESSFVDYPEPRKVVVGDSEHDIRAAKAAGALSVAVCTGWTPEAELRRENPDVVVQDLRDTSWLTLLDFAKL